MTVDYVSLNMIAKEMYHEENPLPKSKIKDYQRSKREQFNKVIELLGLDINEYKEEIKISGCSDVSIEYHIPQRKKVMFKYWIKNYKNTKSIKSLEKLERDKKKVNKLESESINEQIKIAKDNAFMEMSFMLINEYKNDYQELTNIMNILFTKNQYFFSKISETLHRETSKMLEPIFNNLRGEKSRDINDYEFNEERRALRLISQKESVILLLMYKDKIKKLGQELDEIIRIVEEISINKVSDGFNSDNQDANDALNNITEAIKEYSKNKECTTWHNTDFTDYNEEYIKSLLKDITFNQRIGEIEISTNL